MSTVFRILNDLNTFGKMQNIVIRVRSSLRPLIRIRVLIDLEFSIFCIFYQLVYVDEVLIQTHFQQIFLVGGEW